MKIINIIGVAVVMAVLYGCASESAVRKEIVIGDQKIYYVMQSCKPSIKWDGMNVVLDGLKIPSKGDMTFSVGKIDYSEKAIREIKSTVNYFDGLLTATCQTLVRLNSEDAIERYSKHRDYLLSNFANTLSTLEKAETESAAENITKKAKVEAEQKEASFKGSKS